MARRWSNIRQEFMRLRGSITELGTNLAAVWNIVFESEKKKDRLPVEGTLRRLPGQSVREERDKLLNDKLSDYLLLALGFCFLAGWEWFRRWNAFPYGAEILTFVAVVMTAYCGFRIVRLRKDIRNLNLAEKGERRVSELLTQLRRRRYVAFDDVMVSGENVDHVLVGPGGIFAIETKTYSIFGNGCVGVDETGVLRLGNKPALGDPLDQAKRCAEKVTKLLQDRTRKPYAATPMAIFPGWTLKRAKVETGVVVLSDRTITEFFEALPAKFSDTQITDVCSHLNQIARS
jgi:hypothetical protein